ncbi:MAG TPA: hypothetical protein VGU01_15875 [Sphingomicrobium sp.]|nr:hypothetical protein [Sphingomicrobium sp.]
MIVIVFYRRGQTMSDDLSYYARRLEQERRAAAASECRHTRRVHEEMAELYAKMLQVLASAADDPL